MREDIDRWNRKYGERAPSTNIDPDPLIVAHQALLSGGGLCIDLAGGQGNNGLFVAQRGYHSIIVDGSEAGLKLCRHKARGNGLAPMLVAADLDRLTLPAECFDAVLVFHYLNRRLIEDIRRGLRPGGVLLFKTFNRRKLIDRPGFPDKYMLRDGELGEWFGDMHCVASNDTTGTGDTFHWVGYR